MSKYIQFYDMSVAGEWNDYCPEVKEACGSDSVLYVDGRHCLATLEQRGREWAKRYNFVGFKILNTINDRLQETDWAPRNITLL